MATDLCCFHADEEFDLLLGEFTESAETAKFSNELVSVLKDQPITDFVWDCPIDVFDDYGLTFPATRTGGIIYGELCEGCRRELWTTLIENLP